MQKIAVSAKNKEDLISEFFTDDYCFAITKENELIYWPTESEPIWEIECLEEPELIDEFEIMLESPLILLNDFMSGNYPEIDVKTASV